MTEEDTKDYWGCFINESPQSKPKAHEPDYSVLSFIDGLVVASPKKPEAPEKVHPFFQIANEKKTKIGLEVQELINQRHRCKNYSEIHEEEQKKQALKLREKMTKKPSRKGSKGPSLGGSTLPKSRRAPKDRIESDSDEQSSLQQKRERKAGPPYMPNVISMDQLYKKTPKDNDKGKNKEKDPRSRSRSKRYRKELARKKHDSDRGISQERSGETEKKSAQSHIESQEQTSKNIISPSDRLQKTFEETSQSNYLFDNRSMKITSLQAEPKPILASLSQKIEVQANQNCEKIKLDSPSSHESKLHSQSENKSNILKSQQPKQEEELALKMKLANNKKEDILRMERLKQEQNIKAEAERMKRNLEELCKEVAMKKQQLEEKQRRIIQVNAKQMSSKYKRPIYQSKKKSHHYKNRSRSRSPNTQGENWKEKLREITRYNPQDEKYRNRDRRSIQESGFTQMNIEQAHSRKMGKRQQQEEEQRCFQKTSKKRYH